LKEFMVSGAYSEDKKQKEENICGMIKQEVIPM